MATIRTDVPGRGYGSVFVDSLVWGGTAWDASSGPVTYWFGTTSDHAAAKSVKPNNDFVLDPLRLNPWDSRELDAFLRAAAIYSEVCTLTFAPATSAAAANVVWWQMDFGDGTLGQHDIPEGGPLWGVFNQRDVSWRYLKRGGDGFNTILHEIGHGVGLAHPHDGGLRADGTRFPGVPGDSSFDTGTAGLNQGIWTVMSYNTGWDAVGFETAFGNQGGLGAFDIAALQALYGANRATRTGNDVYTLPTANGEGTGWSCIWDAGGVDTITAGLATLGVTIDLRAANLIAGHRNAGGVPSLADGIQGGYTIAKGVVIENATGGAGSDELVGNPSANVLKGRGGADLLRGLGGNDVLFGGGGRDIFRFETALNAARNVDTIDDFLPRGDKIVLEDAVFRALKAGPLAAGAFHATSTSRIAHDATDRVIYQSSTGKLFYDRDGTGAAAPVVFAKLDAGLKVAATDFLVV